MTPSRPGYGNRVRIIGGKWRSRRILFPDVLGLRPTGDRLRETLFNWLAPHLPGSVCLDAFAGSGALGFEALSRGAGQCILLEKHDKAYARLQLNCDLLQAGNARVIHDDCQRWLATPKPPAAVSEFDIVFLDPPFDKPVMASTCTLLEAGHWLAETALIYVEMAADTDITLPANWQLIRQTRIGDVDARLYLRHSPS